MVEDSDKRVVLEPIETEMQRSYIDYAMSVIVGRALPDVRDGFKPVHRKILYAMQDMGNTHTRAHKKSARVVGEVLGKYHPHGDTAAYDALVRMAQDFSLRYPMVDGQGNFGSVDGDSAAAMRYTECRMTSMASLMMLDIDKDTVDFTDNFDGTLKEPTVLPCGFPNLMVNGASGIAVGMATNIPPHNLGEVIDALVRLVDEPEAGLPELMEHIQGPDFPTGGIIYGVDGLMEAYRTGRGRIKVRAKADFEDHSGRIRIIVTEIPYMVNKAKLIENIAELVKDKRIEGISDLRDESDRDGMRIVIELRKDVMEDVVLNQLFKHTQMETTFGIINLALVDNRPEELSLKSMLQHYLEHRRVVVVRRTEYNLAQARKRHHILEGLIVAVDALDETIAIIRAAADAEEARESLIERFELSVEQAKAILDMRLHRLTGLEIDELRQEYADIITLMAALESILDSAERVMAIVRDELQQVKNAHGDDRRTEIVLSALDLDIEDLIPQEEVVITLTADGYVKRMPVDAYRMQHRGGGGKRGITTKEEDVVRDMSVNSSHDHMLFFTNTGRVYSLKAYRIPEGSRTAKGKPVVNLIKRLQDDEEVFRMLPVSDFIGDRYLMFATRGGLVKKTSLADYENININGKYAISLMSGDQLVSVAVTDGSKQVLLATAHGMANRFPETQNGAPVVRPTGRNTRGVRGIRLRKGDRVVAMEVVDDIPDEENEQILLTLTANGYGKRSKIRDYRKTNRGSIGVRNMVTDDRNGPVAGILLVEGDEGIMVTSDKGQVIQTKVVEFPIIGRSTKGVRAMRLKEGQVIVAIERCAISEGDEAEGEEEIDKPI